MPSYQIHRMKQAQRQQFRWAPHTPGVTIVKLKDYEPGQIMEAASPYALWLALRESENRIAVGDLIEVISEIERQAASGENLGPAPSGKVAPRATSGEVPTDRSSRGELRILKYIGFEEARWYVPEPAAKTFEEPVAVT